MKTRGVRTRRTHRSGDVCERRFKTVAETRESGRGADALRTVSSSERDVSGRAGSRVPVFPDAGELVLDRLYASRFGKAFVPVGRTLGELTLDPKRRRRCGTTPSGFLRLETRKKPDSRRDYEPIGARMEGSEAVCSRLRSSDPTSSWQAGRGAGRGVQIDTPRLPSQKRESFEPHAKRSSIALELRSLESITILAQ